VTIAYDTIAPSYARHRGGYAFAVAILNRLYGKSPGGPVLEVGCGTGVYAAAMAEAGARTVYAMDLSHQMLRQAPEHDRIAYLQGRATDLPFADHALDMIFSVNVVHHIQNIDDYMRESFRILEPGGVFCTATDSEDIIRRRTPLSRYWPATVPVELERYHDLEMLRGKMAALGFCDIDECEGSMSFPISDVEAYREKAFSCLQLISEDAFAPGLQAMESDLHAGSLHGTSELAFLWAKRP
jgi:SAM-dependent methyltransferase